MKYELNIQVNGTRYDLAVSPGESLVEVLRDRLGLCGTKIGCDTGGCGACTVMVEGKAIYSCMMPALKANGKDVLTVEGLSRSVENLGALQKSFANNWAFQCGYCTSGMLMAANALLSSDPNPTDFAIREALAGNLCRCTGYTKIIQAIKEVARQEHLTSPR